MESRMKLPLFDDYWIDFRSGTTRRWFAPEAYSSCQGGSYNSLVYDRERQVYRLYYEYSEPVSKAQSHRILAINRGENEEFLKVSVEVNEDEAIKILIE